MKSQNGTVTSFAPSYREVRGRVKMSATYRSLLSCLVHFLLGQSLRLWPKSPQMWQPAREHVLMMKQFLETHNVAG